MASRIRVLYIDNSIGFGGSTKSLSLTVGARADLDRYVLTSQIPSMVRTWYRDFEVHGFRRIMNYRNRERMNRWLEHKVPWAFLRAGARKSIASLDLAATGLNLPRIARLARARNIDLIHLNTGFEPQEGIIASRLLGVPCVVHLRGFVHTRSRLVLSLMKYVACVIGVSRAVSASVPTDRIPPERIVTIYDPVDIDRFDKASTARDNVRSSLGFAQDDIVVAVFGRVVEWKGQLEFTRALMKAIQDHPSLKGLIVGDEADGTPDYARTIRGAIKASGLERHFVFAGYQEHVEPYYHASDIVVHSSIEPEPFGMVVPEAMAAKKPLVAADAGGPREIVTHGRDGLLVAPGDVEAMSAAIAELARDPEKRHRMGLHGYQKVRDSFTIDRVAARVMQVYRDILSRTRDSQAW